MADTIQLKQLTSAFYKNHNLIQMMDKNLDKGRGYGVLLAKVKGLQFAIPLRSKMDINHPFCFDAWGDPEYKSGLDYSKAVVITDSSYISKRPFFTRKKEEWVTIRRNRRTIVRDFEDFVDQYIEAVSNNDQTFLSIKEVKFTTLQNYHNELGI
ncbi:type III toxin-antitoxin system TenpIN family toxin [Pseudalkalibacillus hwajinpoensis]|uniref:type III toxin-antitoxin system TenpIN family toxin n=1 Tax=Guptibacillus hwajinpoensis TaxID=208199 RepID=UPI00384E5225